MLSKSLNSVITRFAPSPTGFLHVGGLRTALFNFLYARRNGGKFVLRIEDTDKNREVAGATENIVDTLKSFKLDFDKGPVKQSERLLIYKKYVDELITKGAAYPCHCTTERLEQLRKEADAAKVPFKYDKHCLKKSPSQSSSTDEEKFVIRQNIPEEGSVEFTDLVHGIIKVENRTLDDGILLKSDGYPVYNLANVVDDHEMKITHVIRGEEFIPSTPKHVLLYQAFGWKVPAFGHLPLILDANRKKLSKRAGDVAVKDYLEKGYLPEALINFIAFLGWNPKSTQEIFSLRELIAEFALDKVNKAGAIFDITKLDFINRQWQKRVALNADATNSVQMSEGTSTAIVDPLYQRTKKILFQKFTKVDESLLKAAWPLILERIKGPSELEAKLPEFYFFFDEPRYESNLLIWKDAPKEKIKKNLEKLKAHFERTGEWGQQATKGFLEKEGLSPGETLWPLRVALSGLRNSPGPFEIMTVFKSSGADGGGKVLQRIQSAIEKL